MPVGAASGIIIIPGPRPGVFFTQALSPAIDPVHRGHIWDDFLGGQTATGLIGSLGWSLADATITTVFYSTLGSMRLSCNVAGARGRLWLAGATFGTDLIMDWGLKFTWIFFTGGAAGNDCVRRISLASSLNTNPPSRGMYLEHLSGETAWYAVVRDDGAGFPGDQIRVNTGIAVISPLWRRLEVAANPITDQIDFYVGENGEEPELVASIDFFMLLGMELNPGLVIVPDIAAAREIKVDLFQLQCSNMVR